MAKVTTVAEAARELGLKHIEVTRRIKRGDIEAQKLGWVWIIELEEVELVKSKPWYVGLMERRARSKAMAGQ